MQLGAEEISLAQHCLRRFHARFQRLEQSACRWMCPYYAGLFRLAQGRCGALSLDDPDQCQKIAMKGTLVWVHPMCVVNAPYSPWLMKGLWAHSEMP